MWSMNNGSSIFIYQIFEISVINILWLLWLSTESLRDFKMPKAESHSLCPGLGFQSPLVATG